MKYRISFEIEDGITIKQLFRIVTNIESAECSMVRMVRTIIERECGMKVTNTEAKMMIEGDDK